MHAALCCQYPDKKLTCYAIFDITAGLTGEGHWFFLCISALDIC
jgi:hypothetical protein